jgi:photosystem II stability/assembly factor-like uncharacterized protein
MRHPPVKAIFEAVRYRDAVNISDVAFVDDETGWICGGDSASGDGVIAVTRNGGRTWVPQFARAGSGTPPCERLYFTDGTTGWATQSDGSLLRTADGERWTKVGTVVPHSRIVFTSHERGFAVGGSDDVRVTTDGGRTWATTYDCRVAYTVGGVAREERCAPGAIAFAPDGVTGYVVAAIPNGNAVAVMKTTDSGTTWAPVALVSEVNARAADVAFTDSLTGYLRAGDALMMTTDGGATWHTTDARPPADNAAVVVAGSVGWMVGTREFTCTLDNGTRWTTRSAMFPARVNAFTVLPSGTGYVVGGGGMVYRYRIVPWDYMTARMITIPAVTTFVPSD